MSQQNSLQNQYQVIIIGCGVSGLAAARRLASQYKINNFLVLEARETYGGRTQTVKTTKGYSSDLGASWIGAKHTRLNEIVKHYKVNLIEQDEDGNMVFVHNGQRHTQQGWFGPDGDGNEQDYEAGKLRLDKLADTINLDNPISSKDALKYDAMTFADLINQNFNSYNSGIAQRSFETAFGTKNFNISGLYGLIYIKNAGSCEQIFKAKGGAQHAKIESGTINLYGKIYEEIKDKVRLNEPVIEIDHSNQNRLVVKTPKGSYTCSNILITAPPNVCNKIKFTPSLPHNRQYLFDNQKAGSPCYKLNLYFKESFWRKKGYSGMIFKTDGLIVDGFDGGTTLNDTKKNVLVVFFDSHQVVDELKEKNCDELLLKKAMKELKFIFDEENDKNMELDDYKFSYELTNSEYIQGCPVGANPVGTYTKVGVALSDPIGKIYFSGSEVAKVWTGYMEGAFVSGEYAIDNMIKTQQQPKPRL